MALFSRIGIFLISILSIIFLSKGKAQFNDANHLLIPRISNLEEQSSNTFFSTNFLEQYKKLEKYDQFTNPNKFSEPIRIIKDERITLLENPRFNSFINTQQTEIKSKKLNSKQVLAKIQKDRLLTNYYISEYLLPLKEAERAIQENKYQEAIKMLYFIYSPPTEGEGNFLNKIIEVKLGSHLSSRQLNLNLNNNEISRYRLMAPDEKQVHKLRIGKTLLSWGNNLFINGNSELAISKYLAVLRLYPKESEILLKIPNYFSQDRFDSKLHLGDKLIIDREVIAMISEALTKLYYELRGADFVGFDETSIPIWSYEFLRETTKEFLNIAKDLERNLYVLIKDENNSELDRLILENGIEMAEINTKIAQNQVGYKLEVLNISEGNSELAKLRIDNKNDYLEAEEELAEFTAKKQKEIQNTQFWSSIASTAVNGVIAYFTGGIGGQDIIEDGKQVAKGFSNKLGLQSAAGSGIGGVVTSAFFGKSINNAQNAIQEKQEELQQQLIEQELAELEAAFDISLNEVKRDSIAYEGAILNLNSAISNESSLKEQLSLKISNDAAFNRETTIRISKEILKTYIEFALELAQLTEKAYQIEELDDTKVIRDENYFYATSQDQQDPSRARSTIASNAVPWLAADKILLDLNTIEFRRITRKKQKENHNSYFISLKNKAPFDLEKLRRSGKMTFDITQYDLDISFPGTYRHLIDEIDITLIALADPTDINMQLTKESLSWTKVPNSFAGSTAIPDWFQSIPSNYSLIVFKDEPETLVLPKNETIRTTPGLNKIFEGKGVCGTYTLEIPKYSNSFNFETIFDVIVEVKFASYFDPILKEMIEAELCQIERRGEKIPKRILSYSIPIVQPDDWYMFHNPIDDTIAHRARIIPFYFYNGYLPNNQHRPKIDGISLATSVKGKYIPAYYRVTSASMNPGIELLSENGLINSSINLDDLNWYEDFNPSSYQEDTIHIYNSDSTSFSQLNTNLISKEKPYELWLLRLDASTNDFIQNQSIDSIFDEQKINAITDIEIAFNYTFSFDYCESEPRILAAMNLDNAISVDSIIKIPDNFEVPYLNVRTPVSYQKSFQNYLTPFEWKTDIIKKTFSLTRVLPEALEEPSTSNPIGSVNDLIPFSEIINIKGSVESIELDFDLKNIGTGYFYLHPNRIRLKASKERKSGRIIKTLEIQVDTSIYDNPATPFNKYRTVNRFTLNEDDDFQIFTRYVNLPDRFSATIELFIVDKEKKLMIEIFDRPIPFERIVNNPQQTNFRLVTMGRDKPKANLILKNIVFRDYSVR